MQQTLFYKNRTFKIKRFIYAKKPKHIVAKIVCHVKKRNGKSLKRTKTLDFVEGMYWSDPLPRFVDNTKYAEPDASWTPEVRRRTAVELFCGRAGISRALNKKHFAVRAVDIKRYRYSKKFLGLYCKSWSRLQQGKYQRKQSNKYDGQKACREANKLLTFVLQWVAKMDLRKGPNGAPPKQYVALEAPVGLFSRTRFAEELERLGLKPTKITWCAFKETVKKETLLYTNVQSILDKGNTEETFCQPLWDAASKKTICSFSKSPHTPVRGRTHACLHYPEKFCDWVAKCITEQVENDDLYNST